MIALQQQSVSNTSIKIDFTSSSLIKWTNSANADSVINIMGLEMQPWDMATLHDIIGLSQFPGTSATVYYRIWNSSLT